MTCEKNSEKIVELKDVCLTVDGVPVLEHIGFSVSAGQIVTLIGPNGAGKTTLLKTVLGVVKPDSGSVWRKEGLKTGYVPQKINLPRAIPLTVERFLRLDGDYPASKLREVLELTGIARLAGHGVHPLSGGETQRLLLARTLLKDPDLLVLDEPAQGLDPVGEERFYALLETLNGDRNCAILMVSHDLHVVMAKTHRVLCVNRHICCSGLPEEVVDRPEYLRLYGERPTLAVYRHRHDHKHLPDGSVEYVD